MGKDAHVILVLDSSVLINFLAINRADLMGRYTSRIYITEHVKQEITDWYPEQCAALENAIAAGFIEQISITDIQEQAILAKFRAGTGKKQLGIGECSAIAVAINRGYELAMDDKAAIKLVKKSHAHVSICTSQDLIRKLIAQGHISIQEADAIKRDWEMNHRFILKIKSFADLFPSSKD